MGFKHHWEFSNVPKLTAVLLKPTYYWCSHLSPSRAQSPFIASLVLPFSTFRQKGNSKPHLTSPSTLFGIPLCMTLIIKNRHQRWAQVSSKALIYCSSFSSSPPKFSASSWVPYPSFVNVPKVSLLWWWLLPKREKRQDAVAAPDTNYQFPI